MASDLEEEMQIESESSVDTSKSRGDPIPYNRYGSLVALVAEDESPETQENVDDKRIETEVAREHFTF